MKKVLIPVDGSASALNAVRHIATRHLKDEPSDIHLVHVCMRLPGEVARFVPQQNLDDYHREEAEAALKPARDLLNELGVPFSEHTRLGDKAAEVHSLAKSLGVSEIVVGTGHKNAFTRMIESSMTNRLMEISDIPVEVIATGKESSLERYGLPAGIGAALTLLVVASE